MQTLIAAVNALTTLFNNTLARVALDGAGNIGSAVPNALLNGTTPLNATSVAFETSRRVKAATGSLIGFSGYNSKSTAQFILMFDSNSATVPANGAVPVGTPITVQGLSNFSYDPGHFSRRFEQGIWLVCSSTANTLTIGSADCWFDAQYV